MAVIEKIGGRTFSFGILSATEGLAVQIAVGRVIGEPLFKALTTTDLKAADKGKALEVAGSAIGLMAARMEAGELLKTMQTVFQHVSVDGQPINIDTHFTGRPKELWQVFLTALKVNFADFFDALPWASGLAGAASTLKQ